MTTATILFGLTAFGLGVIVGTGLGIVLVFKRETWLVRLGLIEPVDKDDKHTIL